MALPGPHFSQQQYGSMHASTDRRKHLNLLLFDQLDEINRIYAGTGRWPTYTLSPHRPLPARAQTAPIGEAAARARFTARFFEQKGMPPEFSGVEAGPLSETALRTMHNTSSHEAAMPLYNNSNTGLTAAASQQEPWQGATQPQQQLHQQQRPASGSLPSLTASSLAKKDAPWLMPWQTGNRETGRYFANMMRKKRTPTGAFANLDLAKAAK